MKKVILIFSVVISNSALAANWIKYGGTSDSELYYDADQIITVKYKNEKNKNSKGIRLRILENLNGPTFKRDDFIFKQAIQSSVIFTVFDCYDNMAYTERMVYSSSKNDYGTLVYEWLASPENIEYLFSKIQFSKEMNREKNEKIRYLVDYARRSGQDPKKVVEDELPIIYRDIDPDLRKSFKGWQIEKIVNKFCAMAE